MIWLEQKWKHHWSTGPMAHKRIASNAGKQLSTENQNESNWKGEVYSGEETKVFLHYGVTKLFN